MHVRKIACEPNHQGVIQFNKSLHGPFVISSLVLPPVCSRLVESGNTVHSSPSPPLLTSSVSSAVDGEGGGLCADVLGEWPGALP